MKAWVLAAATAVCATPAFAALPVGETAPTFKADAAESGKVFDFDLADALKKGPVVLYFFPKAHTSGCDLEAHQFSEEMDKFAALGATVVGVSEDDIGTLKAYSADPETCASRFAVASDAKGEIMKAYDAVAAENPANADIAAHLQGVADRTSYVIEPDGKIVFAFSDIRKPLDHVSGALAALQTWSRAQGQ